VNASIFWRLVWKEYRLQRAFWLAMLVFVPILLGLSMLAGNVSAEWIFVLSLALASLYAVGCGATLFATEHETGTFDFQRAVPVSPWQLFFGKMTFALASTVALLIVAIVVAALFAEIVHTQFDSVRPGLESRIWVQGGLAAAELLLWGTLFSLLLSQPLKAVVFALAGWAAVLTLTSVYADGPDYYTRAAWLRVAVAAAVAAADLGLGLRWFRPGSSRLRQTVLASAANSTRSLPTARPGLGGMFLRLVWQEWQHSRGMLALSTAMVLPAILLWLFKIFAIHSRWGWNSELSAALGAVWMFAAMAAAPLAGAWVFLGDWHAQSYRFLADRGVKPGLVWFSRQAVWLGAVAFWVTAGLLAVLASWPTLRDAVDADAGRFFSGVAVAVLLVFTAYTVGQSCSMLFRNSIVAGFLSLLLSGVVCAWAGLMWRLDVPFVWSVAPIPFSLLLATWLRTPGWLAEQRGLRAWWAPTLAVVLPAVVILVGVPAYRVLQIPAIGPGFNVQEFTRPISREDQATLELYRRALQAFVPRDKLAEYGSAADNDGSRRATDAAWVAANEEAIALALKASGRPAGDLAPAIDPFARDALYNLGHSGDFYNLGHFGDLLSASAAMVQREGRLDAAWERYRAAIRIAGRFSRRSAGQFDTSRTVYRALPGWSAAPGQTKERIAAAINELSMSALPPDAPADSIKASYLRQRRLMEANPETVSKAFRDEAEALKYTLWRRLLPWEHRRALRVVDWLAWHDLIMWQKAETAIRNGDRPAVLVADPVREIYRSNREPWNTWAKWRKWGEAIPLFDSWNWPHSPRLISEYASREAERRAALQILAIAAWKLEHGELPPTLDALVGKRLNKLPADPFADDRALFRYFPDGLPVAIKRVNSGPVVREETVLEANVPFLWSLGPQVVVREQGNPAIVVDRYRVNDGAEWQVPATEQEVWQSGLVFRIP